jgi:hypothetical protein
MAKRADIRIGQRMYEEAMRLFGTPTAAAQRLTCDRKAVYEWLNGIAPSALYLARLDALGGNVLYVITGRKA